MKYKVVTYDLILPNVVILEVNWEGETLLHSLFVSHRMDYKHSNVETVK